MSELSELLEKLESGEVQADDSLMKLLDKLEVDKEKEEDRKDRDKRHQDLIKAIKEIEIEAPKVPEINIPPINVEVPEIIVPPIEVKVPPINVPEVTIPKIEVPKVVMPDEIKVKKPTWLPKIPSITPLVDSIKDLKKTVSLLKWPTDPKKPIAVRLSDGKDFYKAFQEAIHGLTSFRPLASYRNDQSLEESALIDNDRHVQTDILSSALPEGASTEQTLGTVLARVEALTGVIQDLIHTNSHTESDELRIFQENHLCAENTTTTPLLANATFTGEWEDALNYQEINVSIIADKDSASNGLVFQWSADGVNIGDTDVYSYYTASGGTNYTPNPSFRYFRIFYTNGSQAQGSFSLQTILRRSETGGSFHRIDSTLKDDNDARLRIVVPKIKTAQNTYVSQTGTTAGNTKVSLEEYNGTVRTDGLPVTFIPSNQSAFGTLETAELEPVIQLDFVYGINTQTGVSTVANSATVDTNASRLRLQTGTNSAGSAIFRSRRTAKYRPGQGIVARFTPLFTTGVANSTQIWGVGQGTDGFFFGYNGTAFGILHRNAGNDTWITEANWNGNLDFTWNKTFGIPVMIKYPYLGYGDIFFYVQNPTTGAWILVHTIRYSNTTASVELSNPNIYFYGQALNSGNTSNLTMYCGSVGIFLSGKRSYIGSPKWATDNNKSGITTETNILTLKNATTYNGVSNRSLMRLSNMSISSSAASGIAEIRLKNGATLGGTPSFTTINGTTGDNGATITSGHSITSYDTAGTTITGGNYIFGITVDNPNSNIIDLEPYNIYLAPGETLTVSGFSTISSAIGVSINWVEDV